MSKCKKRNSSNPANKDPSVIKKKSIKTICLTAKGRAYMQAIIDAEKQKPQLDM